MRGNIKEKYDKKIIFKGLQHVGALFVKYKNTSHLSN